MTNNAWVARDNQGRVLAYGDRSIPESLKNTATIEYKPELADAEADPDVILMEQSLMLIDARDNAISENRKQAFVRKENAARLFLAAVPDVAMAGNPALIDATLYAPLHKEYAATYSLLPAGYTPWDLARAIVSKADAVDDAEVARRVAILTAENAGLLTT